MDPPLRIQSQPLRGSVSEVTHKHKKSKSKERGCSRADLFTVQWVGVLCLGMVGTTLNFVFFTSFFVCLFGCAES